MYFPAYEKYVKYDNLVLVVEMFTLLCIYWTLIRFQIFSSGEKYESDADCPEILMWFPKQEDFVPPPPVDETFLEKIDRLGAAVKVNN